MYLQATLRDGTRVVSEFTKPQNIARYAAQCFAGMRPFNAWQTTGNRHPYSGEEVLVRQWRLINGREVMTIEQVQPRPGFETSHDMQPENFEPVPHVQQGPQGGWTAPAENTPEGAVVGARYPVHVTEGDLRTYVILRAADAQGQGEIRHYVDRGQVTSRATVDELIGGTVVDEDEGRGRRQRGELGPGDGDDDVREEDFR
jgi:hypothetical protein